MLAPKACENATWVPFVDRVHKLRIAFGLLLIHGIPKLAVDEVWVFPPDIGIAGEDETWPAFEGLVWRYPYDYDGKRASSNMTCQGNNKGILNWQTQCKATLIVRNFRASWGVVQGGGANGHTTGHTYEHLGGTSGPATGVGNEYLVKNSMRFFNLNLNQMYPELKNSGIWDIGGHAFTFANDSTGQHTIANMSKEKNPDADNYTIHDWGKGCGQVHYPSNAKYHYDGANQQMVYSSCVNYGMRNGPNGEDLKEFDLLYYPNANPKWPNSKPYSWMPHANIWFLHMYQSMPGYNSPQFEEGSATTKMKSWWTFMWY